MISSVSPSPPLVIRPTMPRFRLSRLLLDPMLRDSPSSIASMTRIDPGNEAKLRYSPDQFHRELAGAAGTRTGNASERGRRGQRRVWIVEIHLIEGVEELAAQLQAQAGPERDVAENGQVGVQITGPVDEPAPRIPIDASGNAVQRHERRRVEI